MQEIKSGIVYYYYYLILHSKYVKNMSCDYNLYLNGLLNLCVFLLNIKIMILRTITFTFLWRVVTRLIMLKFITLSGQAKTHYLSVTDNSRRNEVIKPDLSFGFIIFFPIFIMCIIITIEYLSIIFIYTQLKLEHT